jgi:hypothetical protein
MNEERTPGSGSQTLAFIGIFAIVQLFFLSLLMLYTTTEKSILIWWDILKTITVPLLLSCLVSIPVSAIIVKKLEK